MNTVIDNYESLSSLMGLMREAAAQGQWNRLLDLETQCRQQVETMKQADVQMQLDPTARAKKRDLILKILADDATIRRHTQPWMEQLQRLMRSTRQEQQVRQAYGGG
ncbi:MAG: flagellar protein FliT [Betaproteobacteria bacterium]|nr:flagellar protein FliT [Betaproteobacteria bacterium]